jgi:uncharacterized protein (TIGR02145 family)
LAKIGCVGENKILKIFIAKYKKQNHRLMYIKHITPLIFFILSNNLVTAQEKVLIEGAIILGNSEATTPDAGTVRWTGNDFEGWTGSNWVSLTSGPCEGLSFVKDVEANAYPTVAIGTQCWTAVNLRTEKYNDGSSIPYVNTATNWGSLITPAFCWYDDDIQNMVPYGALYNWHAIDTLSNGNKNICPVGWHVPRQTEVEELVDFLNGNLVAGNELKEAGNVHFLSNNETATNESGFTAIPGGYRTGIDFYEKGYYAQYWLTTSVNATTAKFLDIQYDGEYANISDQNKNLGNSIRCIKD